MIASCKNPAARAMPAHQASCQPWPSPSVSEPPSSGSSAPAARAGNGVGELSEPIGPSSIAGTGAAPGHLCLLPTPVQLACGPRPALDPPGVPFGGGPAACLHRPGNEPNTDKSLPFRTAPFRASTKRPGTATNLTRPMSYIARRQSRSATPTIGGWKRAAARPTRLQLGPFSCGSLTGDADRRPRRRQKKKRKKRRPRLNMYDTTKPSNLPVTSAPGAEVGRQKKKNVHRFPFFFPPSFSRRGRANPI